jgi:magnesium chelatase accessory protein
MNRQTPADGDLDWASDGSGWPNAAHSRFERVGDLTWHVQEMGSGPAMLLVHGTGSSTHSWAALAPLLATRFQVIAPDLPGHGFTQLGSQAQSSLPGMASSMAALLNRLALTPALAVGHSAGAAVLARMCFDGAISPRALISLNGALLPLRGLAGQFFAPAAKLLAGFSLVPRLFSWRGADRRVAERLIRDTGSTLEPEMVDLYHRLIRSPSHVSGTLRMMANWDLEPLSRQLHRIAPLLYLIACENDRTVPPSEARRLHRLLPESHLVALPGLGHLGHEERPERFAQLICEIADAHDIGA